VDSNPPEEPKIFTAAFSGLRLTASQANSAKYWANIRLTGVQNIAFDTAKIVVTGAFVPNFSDSPSGHAVLVNCLLSASPVC
jgi:hypothetical protein